MDYPYEPYKWWVNNVLPIVYDDSLSYYEVVSKLKYYVDGLVYDVKRLTEIVNTIEGIEDVTEFTKFLKTIQAEIGNLANLQTTSKTDLVSAINEIALKANIAYYKPPTGIPESDLSQEVQDKLNNGEAAEYIINNKKLKKAPNNNSPAELGLGTYSVPDGGIPWDTLSQDVRDRINAGGGTGGTTDYTDLNNKPQINGHTLNAGNNTAETIGLGTYSKPRAGIPESDLSAEVQEKLNTSGGIADSETSFVATRDYEAGELIYINGVLYKTKYKILSGTNLVPGNNIEVTDISAEIERINSEIDALQSGSGPDSWNLTAVVESTGPNQITNFFEYFNCIGGENYNFILDPVEPTLGYYMNIYKRDGTVVHAFDNTTYPQYANRQRFTFTPDDTGEYYCTIKKNTSADPDITAHARVTIEYTQSQGISELWSKVNAAQSVESRVSALEPLVEQHQASIEGLDEEVETVESDVTELKSAFTYADVANGTVTTGTLNGITYNKINDNTFSLYGTAANTRCLSLYNGSNVALTSANNAAKYFQAGLYKFEWTITGSMPANTDVMLVKSTLNNDDLVHLTNGDTVFSDVPFNVAFAASVGTIFGTENEPSTFELRAILLAGKEPFTLLPTHDQTDRTLDIRRLLMTYGCCQLVNGEYYVSGIVMPDSTTIKGIGDASRIILSGDSNGPAIKMGSKCNVENVTILGNNEGDIVLPTTLEPTRGDINYLNNITPTSYDGYIGYVLPAALRQGLVSIKINATSDNTNYNNLVVRLVSADRFSTANQVGVFIIPKNSDAWVDVETTGPVKSLYVFAGTNSSASAGFEVTINSADLRTSIPAIGNRHGIDWSGANKLPGIISNCRIERFAGGAIHEKDTTTDFNRGLMVTNCYLCNNHIGIYIESYSEYNKICNCIITHNYFGILSRGGNNIISNCGADGNIIGIQMDADAGGNNGHSSICNTTMNHTDDHHSDGENPHVGYGLIVKDTGRILISNCFFAYSKVLLENTNGNVISGCNFMSYAKTEVKDGQCSMIMNCMMLNEVHNQIELINNSAAKVINCFYRAGGEVVPIST